MSPETLILDNGCFNIKIGYAGSNSRLFPNAIIKSKFDKKRIYIADEIEQLSDKTSLYFSLPIERGYLVNWDTQLQIWNKLFGKDNLNVDYKNCRIILTDPSDISSLKKCLDLRPDSKTSIIVEMIIVGYMCQPGLYSTRFSKIGNLIFMSARSLIPTDRAFSEDNTEEIIFENYCFHSLIRTSAPSCAAQIHCSFENPCCIIVDSGHSFTHIVPYIQGKIAKSGVLRIDVGGKALTNQLKDWISYRQLNVTDETYVINCCKEDVCFVSTDFQEDMKNWRAKRLDYLLPDFVTLMRGEKRGERRQMSRWWSNCPQ
uniref:Actin-related protein 6 n=1 Tax=Meloidogyne incognita TaxID=6306 RepID=A0A914MK08_MELIC